MRRCLYLMSVALFASMLAVAAPRAAQAQRDDADGESGQVTVTPGDPFGEITPPEVRMDAEYGRRLTGPSGSSSGNTGASGGSGGTSGAGNGPGVTCRVEPVTGLAGSDNHPQTADAMKQLYPDMYMGSRGGDESKVYNVFCSDGSGGWVVGDGAGGPAGGAGGGPQVVLPSPAELAERARQLLRLPLPAPGMSPKVRLSDGQDATLVRENTWLWTEPDVWEAQTKRVQVGPVWAEVTARPTSMQFSSELGDSVTCEGPGTPYERRYGLHAASPDCGLRFERSGPTTAEYAITWSVSWTGSTGGGSNEGGELPDMISRASESFVVAEAQSLRAR